jgi:hypothetical protein
VQGPGRGAAGEAVPTGEFSSGQVSNDMHKPEN